MNIKYLSKFLLFLVAALLLPLSCDAAEKQCVILLHGLGRTHHSMSSIESLLKMNNYIVINEDYPSTKESIEELANNYIPLMVNQCLAYHAKHINFVTHSMGGVVLEEYLQSHKIPGLSRIVMLGPPNHGSELVDLLRNNWLFKYFTGPSGQELTTYKTSIPNTLQMNNHYQIGVIAGNSDVIPFNNYIFHESNDGKVTISSTKMKNMSDFIILPVSHTFMMKNASVENQILSFLDDGKFIHSIMVKAKQKNQG